MKYLLKKMKHKKNRSATFICSLSIKFPNNKLVNVVGKAKGEISKSILGRNGFGYDPIFIPKFHKKTYGQMLKSKKIKIDHRYLAFRKLKKKVKIL